jgi:hypothetical protein
LYTAFQADFQTEKVCNDVSAPEPVLVDARAFACERS